MAGELHPDDVIKSLSKGRLAPIYLFYGPDEFRIEKLLERIRNEYIPEGSRDFNLEICYGGETEPSDIISRAQSLPFMSTNRLIIVRRTEEFKADQLEKFLPYIENPCPSTCLLFIAFRTDFKKKFFKKLRSSGYSVDFPELRDSQVIPWIRNTARELGLKIDINAANYLHQVVGTGLRELYGELEKLTLSHIDEEIGVNQVNEVVVHSRIYTIFELMNVISKRDLSGTLSMLNSFLEEEDKIGGPLRFIGMLNRQIKLLWQTKSIMEKGGKSGDVAKKLGLSPFSAKQFMNQSKNWSQDELARGLSLLLRADRLLKSGSRPKPVLENLMITFCG